MYVESVLNSKGWTVVTAKPDTPINNVLKIMTEAGIGAVVISRDNTRVDGILSEREIIEALAFDGKTVLTSPASAVMTRDVVTCSLSDHVSDLMAIMTEKRVRHLPVLDKGSLSGLISIGDVVKCRVQEMESEAQSLRAYVAGS